MRDIVRFCLRTFFTVMKVRCQIAFDENKLPAKAVYVSNHVSFLDPLLLFAFLPGNPIFALNGHLYRNKWIRLFMRTADIMPSDESALSCNLVGCKQMGTLIVSELAR